MKQQKQRSTHPSCTRLKAKLYCMSTLMLQLILCMMFSISGNTSHIYSYHYYAMPSDHTSLAPTLINANDKCVSTQRQYRPEGPVGIRFKKQLLISRDMSSALFDSHMLEAASKKKHFLFLFEPDSMYDEDFQLQQLCPNLEEAQLALFRQQDDDIISQSAYDTSVESFCAVNPSKLPKTPLLTPPTTYMSTQFYKPKYPHIQGSSPSKGEAVASGGIQIQVQGGEQLIDIPRDNHYLNLALGVKPYYELPVNTIECIDQEQTIEGFLFKKAKTNNIANYNLLRNALEGVQELKEHKSLSLDVFQRYAFTYEDPDLIANLTNGMRPNPIQKLKPQSSTLRYFTQELEITPQKISFDECQLLIPKFEVFKITNKQRKKDVIIRAIVTSTPELTLYLNNGAYLDQAIRLRPQDTIEIKVAFTSETLGLFEALMYIVVDEWIYVASFNAFVVPNAYDIQPFYITDLGVNHTIELPLYILNPSTTDTLIIEELFSTEEDVKLRWPHNKEEMSENLNGDDNGNAVQYILIPEGSKKQIATMVFEINRPFDFNVQIHIRTSLHDIIRVPLYYHVHQDYIKFTPSVLDFGLAPLNFDILKIPIYARSKLREALVIQDVLLPMGDNRLDFQLVDLGRNNVIRSNKEVFIGNVLLNPTEAGVIETKLTIIANGQKTNQTYVLHVPIVGRVHQLSNFFGPLSQESSGTTFSPPIAIFDLSKHLLQESAPAISRRKINEPPLFKPDLLLEPLRLTNNFNVPILLKGLVNQNPELKIVSQGMNAQQGSPKPILLQPGESIEYAKLELNTELLKISQGNKYLSLHVNNTLIPIAVSLYDRALLCSWDEQEHLINLENIPLCTNPYELNFDYVAINDVKQKKLKITNLNPRPITIETVAKQQLDDLNIYIEKVVDKNGQPVNVPLGEFDQNQPILGPKRTKRQINFIIQPQQTLQLVFQVLAKEPKQKFSRIDFTIKEGDSFQINYKYHVISGQLTFIPQVVQFGPSYPGMIQQRQLTARSTFEVPITVKAILSNDFRIMPFLQPLVIKPNNKTEFGSLTFDPSKHSAGQSPINFGNGALKNMEISGIFNHPHINFDHPMFQQNIMQIINGLQNGIGQQNQLSMVHMSKAGTPVAIMTPHDLETYRDRQRLWDEQSGDKKGEITTFVTIETNVYPNLTVPVRAQLKKPSLTETSSDQILEVLDFETVQIGQYASKSVRIVNPTDDPLVVALFVVDLETHERIINLAKKEISPNQERAPVPSDKDYFYQMFCQPKIREAELSKKGKKVQKVDEDLMITLSSRESQLKVCQQVHSIISQLSNSSTDEADVLRRRLEGYFKDNYLAELQRDFNQQAIPIPNLQNQPKRSSNKPPSFEQVLGMTQQFGGGNSVWMPFEPEIENVTNLINQQSHARPIDTQTLNILKANYERQKEFLDSQQQQKQQSSTWFGNLLPDLWTFYDSFYSFLKAVFVGRHQRLPPPPSVNVTKMEKPKRELRYKEPRGSQYRLKNGVINDIMINNETSKLYRNQIILSDPMIVTYTGQAFFVSPSSQGQVYKVEPRSNLTIKDAIIFQPQSIQGKTPEMKLLIKNNLTLLHSVDLKGQVGTGVLEVQRVLKKGLTSIQNQEERYMNAPTINGYIYGPHLYQQSGDQVPEYENLSKSSQQNKQLITERILGNIYGHKEREGTSPGHREVLIRTNYNKYGGMSQVSVQAEQDPGAIPFHITHDDIFIPASAIVSEREEQRYQWEGEYDYVEDHESLLVNRILENAAHKHNLQEVYNKFHMKQIKVQTYHKRVFVIQNTGNLPLNVDKIYFEDGSMCQSQRFVVENCQSFLLNPGESYWLHIGYQNQFTFAKIKKKLILETKQGVVQEFNIEVQLPVDYLQAANDMLPLTKIEEWQQILLKLVLLSAAFASLSLVAKDCFSHLRYTTQYIPDVEEKLALFEDTKCNTHKTHEKMPVLREYVLNEQVFMLYQQAQDKLQDRSGVGRGQQAGQQLLLKEVANICSNRRQLVCLEAQKQAIEAEKELRKTQGGQRNLGYQLEQQLDREQIILAKQREKELASAKEALLLEQILEQQRKAAEAKALKATIQQPQNETPIKKTQTQPPKASAPVPLEHSKDQSILSENSDSSHPQTHRPQEEEDADAKKKPKALAPKITKKQAARLQKQKQAEENFRKLEEERKIKKEKEEEEQKRRQIVERAKRQEEMEAMAERARLEKVMEEERKKRDESKKTVLLQRKIELASATPSETQSVMLDNESQSPLNISAFNPQTTTSQNVDKLKGSQFNFEQKSLDKQQYQISGVSQIDKKDQHINDGLGEVGEDSGFLEHFDSLKDKERQSLRSQNRPLFDKYFLAEHQSSENHNTQSHVLDEDLSEEKQQEGGQQDTSIHDSGEFMENKKRSFLKKRESSNESHEEVKSKANENLPLIIEKSKQEYNPSAQDKKLTKDDLLPFFQSQKASESKNERERSGSQKKILTNPSPAGSYLSASIFSYNPLNIFREAVGADQDVGKINSKNQSPNLPPTKARSIIQDKLIEDEDNLPTDFANIDPEEIDDQEDGEEDEETTSSNIFHAFQKASSIFSKPLFNTTIKAPLKTTNAYGGFYQVPSNASSYYNQNSAQPVRNEQQIPQEGAVGSGFSIFSEGPSISPIDSKPIGTAADQQQPISQRHQTGQQIDGFEGTTGIANYQKPNQPKYGQSGYDLWQSQNASQKVGKESFYGDSYYQDQQQSQAYLRNRQSLYGYQQPLQQYSQGAPNYSQYPQPQYGQAYQYPPPPPPGFGFRPPAQSKTLYAQYSAGNPNYISGGPPPGLGFSEQQHQQRLLNSGGSSFQPYKPTGGQQPVFNSRPVGQGSFVEAGDGSFGAGGSSGSGVFVPTHNRSGSGGFAQAPSFYEQSQYQVSHFTQQPHPTSTYQQSLDSLLGNNPLLSAPKKKQSSFVKPEEEENEDQVADHSFSKAEKE